MRSLRILTVSAGLAVSGLGCSSAASDKHPKPPVQEKMTSQEESLYRDMIKASGVDPDQVLAASKQVDASRKWTEAKSGRIHYHIEGGYQGQVNVVGGSNWIGYADVTDRVVIELDWNLLESKLAGKPLIQNAKSTTRNLRNPEPTCLPPILRGDYEHGELLEVRDGLGGALELLVRTSYPLAEVAPQCTGSRVKVPASTRTEPEGLTVPSPVLLTAKAADLGGLLVSKDQKSMTLKNAGWTWVFTPSVKP
jgi:hypothetical protein